MTVVNLLRYIAKEYPRGLCPRDAETLPMTLETAADMIERYAKKTISLEARLSKAQKTIRELEKEKCEERHEKWYSTQSMVEERAVCCNGCGTIYSVDALLDVGETIDGIGQAALPNYCPHCGARMDAKILEDEE